MGTALPSRLQQLSSSDMMLAAATPRVALPAARPAQVGRQSRRPLCVQASKTEYVSPSSRTSTTELQLLEALSTVSAPYVALPSATARPAGMFVLYFGAVCSA